MALLLALLAFVSPALAGEAGFLPDHRLADLRVEIDELTLPRGQLYPGGPSGDLQFRLINDGGTEARDFYFSVVLSADAALSQDDRVLLRRYGGVLNRGESRRTSYNVSIPYRGVGPGAYTVFVVIDSDGTVPESNEANNAASLGLVVGAAGSGVLGIDFDYELGTYSGPGVLAPERGLYWNGVRAVFAEDYRIGGLVESDGTVPSRVTVELSSTFRGRSVGSTGGVLALLGDFLGSTEDSLRISGLDAEAVYDLVLYSASSEGASLTIDGESRRVEGADRFEFVEGETYLVFRGLRPRADGEIVGLLGANPSTAGTEYTLSGLQLARRSEGVVTRDAQPERAAPAVRVWPNPTSGPSQIQYSLEAAGQVRIAVYDVLGRAVRQRDEGARAAGLQESTLDLSGLAPGLYTVGVTTANGHRWARVTVAR